MYGPDGSKLADINPIGERPVDNSDLGGPHTGDRIGDGYPAYEVLSFNGVKEVLEFKKPEPLFYVVDDPALIARVEKAASSK